MAELSTNTQPSVIDEITSKLTDIKDKIKQSGITTTMFNELSSNAKILQGKLDELLQKKGLYTQSDINDAYDVLQEFKRKEMERESRKSINRAITYILIVGVVVGGLYLLSKRK
jgi:hypothetical protein